MTKSFCLFIILSTVPFVVVTGLLGWGYATDNDTWHITITRDGLKHQHYIRVDFQIVNYVYWGPGPGEAIIQIKFVSWKVFAFISPLPMLWMWQFIAYMIRMRKRRKSGWCLECGYDLCESKDRCPECGALKPASV